MKRTLLLCAVVLFMSIPFTGFGQIESSKIGFPLFYANYGMAIPGGALSDQFGMSNQIGGGLLFKTSTNWIFGVEGEYMFGQNIKNEEELFSLLQTDQGFVIDDNGYRSEIRLHLRGINFFGRFGKLFNVFGPNENSGIAVIGGVGYLDHFIFIDVMDNLTEPLASDYRYGYDRYAGGFALSQFIGYMHFSNKQMVNFFVGFEAKQAFSSYYRDWDFNAVAPYPDYDGVDMFFSLKVGWIFPVYRRAPKEYYID